MRGKGGGRETIGEGKQGGKEMKMQESITEVLKNGNEGDNTYIEELRKEKSGGQATGKAKNRCEGKRK